jgi:hypothetical protein
MRMLLAAALFGLGACASAPASAPAPTGPQAVRSQADAKPAAAKAVAAKAVTTGPAAAVEKFMWDYTKAWNRHDSATIAKNFYRTGPSVEEQTLNLERGFENLRAQGYDHSDIFEVKGCMTGKDASGADTAWAGMKFSRLKKDGQPLPPKDRASSYTLTKFPDGWRITKVGVGGVAADKPLACPAG